MSFSARAADPFPGLAGWPVAEPADLGMDASGLERVRGRELGRSSAAIVHRGRLVGGWGGRVLVDLKSTGKSIGSLLLGVALQDGLLALDKPLERAFYEAGAGGWPDLGEGTPGGSEPSLSDEQREWLARVTPMHLGSHTGGFPKSGEAKPPVLAPGEGWLYSDGGVNWIGDALTALWGRDLLDVMRERVLAPLGARPEDFRWRQNRYRSKRLLGVPRRETSGGMWADVRTMARLGQLVARDGVWGGQRLAPKGFFKLCHRVPEWRDGFVPQELEKFGTSPRRYGFLWWSNQNGDLPGVPRDALWAWGLNDSLIFVVPSIDLVVARAGRGWTEPWRPAMDHLEAFVRPIVECVDGKQRLKISTS